MPHADFIHLHAHSAYSLSAGAIKVKELPVLCRKLGMPAVAMTDTGNLFGALEFSIAAAEEGIQPIIGCELPVTRPTRDRDRASGRVPAPEPLVLLCQNDAGYRNLIRLVSNAYLEGPPGEPQVPLEALEGSSDGLICLTGGLAGPLGQRLLEGDAEGAAMLVEKLRSLFPGRLYIELQRHGLEAEKRIEPAMLDFAYRLELPLVATNDCFFAERDFSEAHDVLLCIAQGTTIHAADRKQATPEHYFKPASEMRKLFEDLPEACDNSLAIARRCAFFVRKIKPMLPSFDTAPGRDENEEMAAQARAGLDRRLELQVFPTLKPEDDRAKTAAYYHERLDYELGVISKMGFSGYFLIVADFIKWAKAQEVPIPVGPGRGSGAGSVCAWSLTITDIDPIRFGLFFERFLNPERVSMPDFDIDFCQDGRDRVLDYVKTRYGEDRVAQIITFGKLQARAVLRDVGRVLAMPFGQVDRICKMVPNNPANPVTLKQAIAGDEQLRQMRDSDETVARLMTIALKLEGLYRHASTHAAGVVIGNRPLEELVPLYRDPRSDMRVTQFNMKYVEDAGLVKFDFLGLKTLTVIDRAVRLVNAGRTAGEAPLDPLTMPLDDAGVFEMLSRGTTVGVFQFESAGMRDLLRKLKPDKFEDLIAVVSLYRPGPMDSIPEYIAVKHGTQKADYMHAALEPILAETYGVMTYQEQVMKIAQLLAGYTLGGADLLRRAMGKKIKSEMDNQRKLFLEGAAKSGLDEALANLIFDKMAKFAGYGFNKGHAAPYAFIAYQTAYLKANHPVEFMAASMSLDLANTDKLNVFRQELQRLDIPLLPPDLNRSQPEFSVEMDANGVKSIRYALAAVKGVGAGAMAQLVAERAKRGAFKDLFDFAERIDTQYFNKRQYENLVNAGAFDALNRNRAQNVAAAETVLRHAAISAEERDSQQIGLFGGAGGSPAPRPALPAVADWLPGDKLQHEFGAIGFYLSSHPLDPYRKAMKRLDVIPASAIIANAGKPGRIRLAGIVVGRKERTSAKGNRFAFVQMSDMSGLFEVMLFSELLKSARPLLDSGQPLLVSVDAKIEDADFMRLTAQSFELLDNVAATSSTGFVIEIAEPKALEPVRRAIEADREQGRTKLKLLLNARNQQVEMALPGYFRMGPGLMQAVRAIPGVVELRDF